MTSSMSEWTMLEIEEVILEILKIINHLAFLDVSSLQGWIPWDSSNEVLEPAKVNPK